MEVNYINETVRRHKQSLAHAQKRLDVYCANCAKAPYAVYGNYTGCSWTEIGRHKVLKKEFGSGELAD